MEIHVEVVPRGHGKTSEAELEQIEGWSRELFAPDRDVMDAFEWEDKRGLGFNLQAYRSEELVGFAHVFARIARRDGSPVLMGALGGVMTARQHQGAGVGAATVKKANEIILRNLRADLGVLVCRTSLVPFYESLGWQRMRDPVLIEQPAGPMEWPHEAMLLQPSSEDALPEEIDLCGPPF